PDRAAQPRARCLRQAVHPRLGRPGRLLPLARRELRRATGGAMKVGPMKPEAVMPVDIARRGALRRLHGAAMAQVAWLLAGCLRRDPGIGVALVYESTTPAAVTDLWFDETRILGGRVTSLYISPHGPAHEA